MLDRDTNNHNFEEDIELEGENDLIEDDQSGDMGLYNSSSVASMPAKNIIIMGAAIFISIIFLYFIIFSGDDEDKSKKNTVIEAKKEDLEKAKELEDIIVDEEQIESPIVSDIPPLDEIQPLVTPILPKKEDIQQIESFIDPFENFTDPRLSEQKEEKKKQEPEKELPDIVRSEQPSPVPAPITQRPLTEEELNAIRQKRSSNIMLLNGGGTQREQSALNNETPPGQLALTSEKQQQATIIGDIHNTIAQGKIIDAVLETAVNTDLPGMLRAIISKNIYAEFGDKILIPRGSRLIGSYDNDISRGQKRVLISWNRLITPQGIDIALQSPGTDNLGRAGIGGRVDNRYLEIFGNSILLSTLTVLGASLFETVTDGGNVTNSTTNNTNGSVTSSSTGTTTEFAIADAVDNIGDAATDIAESFVSTQPTITINQGTPIKVFVNRDLVFPENLYNDINYIK